MLRTSALLTLSLLAAAIAAAQNNMPLIDENGTTRVSDHVWAIVGWPNIAIVVGNRATLVVDSGLGPRNGATIMRVVKKVSTAQKLYLTTTHFHVEHTAGEAGFPADTILIRPAAQQEEVEKSVDGMIARFSTMSPQNRELLAGVKLRAPDMVFDTEIKLDLGGVTARLMSPGAAHTKGDELIFVEPDSTLIPGDVVQDKLVPRVNRGEGSPKGWLAVLDKIEQLKPRSIIPDHGNLGDVSLIAKERAFILDLQSRALALKRQGVPVGDAGKQLMAEFKSKYPDWQSMDLVVGFVERVYEEN
jgi:glyoxylase-like metal-dependent hydrolase (beta-lactamase superfamily II)